MSQHVRHDEVTISRRKREHIEVAVRLPDVASGGWDDVHLVHRALPEVDLVDIDTSVSFLGRQLSLPLVIPGMTGAHAGATEVNARLARAAQREGIALGVGSQRAAVLHPELSRSFSVVRTEAPDAFVIANVGVSQLIEQDDGGAFAADQISAILEMVRADALAVHLNFLEEVVQPEGQTRASGALAAIGRVVASCPVPVIAKETGCGVSREVAALLAGVGVSAVDVGGLGGTSFLRIESARAAAQGDHHRVSLGEAFLDWGIPTAVSVAACAPVLPTLAVGGVRKGTDAAKALALGAVAVGVGRPLIERALESDEQVSDWISTFRAQLRVAAFLAGTHRVADLTTVPRVVVGETAEWLDQLGLR